MLFQAPESTLKLDIVNYEFPADGGAYASDDRNWLVLRCTWMKEDGDIRKDSNSCLLTYELREMTAGLKVVRAGIKDAYESDFVEPYFALSLRAEGEDAFRAWVSFFLPNTMDGEDTAEVECVLTRQQLSDLVEELDKLCGKFPERT